MLSLQLYEILLKQEVKNKTFGLIEHSISPGCVALCVVVKLIKIKMIYPVDHM